MHTHTPKQDALAALLQNRVQIPILGINVKASILNMKPSFLIYLAILFVGTLIVYALMTLDNSKSFIVGDHSEWFWAMIQAIILLVSIFYIYGQIELQRSSNTLQLILQLRQEWYTKKMLKYRKGACDEYRAHKGEVTDEEMSNAETEVANFFESMGTLYKHLEVPKGLIWDLYAEHIEHLWPMLEKRIDQIRKLPPPDTTFFANFEGLWIDMRSYSKERGAPSDKKTPDEIDRYVERELRDLVQDLLDSD